MANSARPELLVDPAGQPTADQQGRVGQSGPLGRARLVSALPLRDGPVTIVKPMALAAADGALLADPDQVLVGTAAVRVHRLLHAERTLDTRRL